tara:strand:- start:5 stop:325 length:321 start_codon:yes stop_codon:yes gene_type:complete
MIAIAVSLTFYNMLKINNHGKLNDQFLDAYCNSNKWDKWIIDKRKIAKIKYNLLFEHYIFSSDKFKVLKKKIKKDLQKKFIKLDQYSIDSIISSLEIYLIYPKFNK